MEDKWEQLQQQVSHEIMSRFFQHLHADRNIKKFSRGRNKKLYLNHSQIFFIEMKHQNCEK